MKIKKIISLFLVSFMILSTMTIFLDGDAKAAEKEISIIFTGDMHSHLETEETNKNGEVGARGGFAKLKTLKNQIEEKYKGTFMLDAGDFSMGTPFQSIYRTDAAELKTMAEVGYDAIAIGNHEFDYKAQGLADMLNVAAGYNPEAGKMPAVLIGNVNWGKTLSDSDTKAGGTQLKSAFANYGVADYTIIEKDGMRMAIFAVMGDEAISNAPEAGVAFDDYISRAREIVKEIELNGDADIVVALSHSGINDENFDESEDVKLAEEVEGIDVIVSGHSHTELAEAKTVKNTTIVASGEYANNAGHIVLEKEGDNYKVKKYQLVPLDKNIENDKEIDSLIGDFKNSVNSKFFSKYGYKYDQVLAKNNI